MDIGDLTKDIKWKYSYLAYPKKKKKKTWPAIFVLKLQK